jgi:hypothetical protein
MSLVMIPASTGATLVCRTGRCILPLSLSLSKSSRHSPPWALKRAKDSTIIHPSGEAWITILRIRGRREGIASFGTKRILAAS